MAEEPPIRVVESDEDYSDAPPPKKPKNEASALQSHFSYHLNAAEKKMMYLSRKHRASSIVIVADSPFAHSSFRVLKSRHSTGDKTWDKDFEALMKAAIQYKTDHPQETLGKFLAQHVTTPVTEERLQTAMRLCVDEGKLAPMQYLDIFKTVENMEKEEKQKAKNKKKNSEKDFSSIRYKRAAAEAMELDLTGDASEGEEEVAVQGATRAASTAARERQAANGSLGTGESDAAGSGLSERDNNGAEGGPAAVDAGAGRGADGDEAVGGAAAAAAAADEAGPSQSAARKSTRSKRGQKYESFIAELQQSPPPRNKPGGSKSEATLTPEEIQLAAKIAEEVHFEMFLEKKAKGNSNPTACDGYLQETATRMIDTHPEGSEGRARLQAYFSNDQAIRNLVNGKLKLKVAVFKHVIEYEEEKAAAAAAAEAAQLKADRLGEFNVPLPFAAEEEVASFMERFLDQYIQVIPPRVAQFKAPTQELKDASPTIITRAQQWEKQHNAIKENIKDFCNKLKSCVRVALV